MGSGGGGYTRLRACARTLLEIQLSRPSPVSRALASPSTSRPIACEEGGACHPDGANQQRALREGRNLNGAAPGVRPWRRRRVWAWAPGLGVFKACLKRHSKRPGSVSPGKVREASRAWGPGEFLATSARAGVSGPGLRVAMATAGGGAAPLTRAGGTGPELRGASRVRCMCMCVCGGPAFCVT